MKKTFSVITMLFIAVSTFAQFNEGKVKYSLNFSSTDPQIQAQMGMFQGSTLQMYFSPEFNRVEMNMGMFMQTTTVSEIKTGESVTLMSGMIGKKATKLNSKDIKTDEKADVEVEKTTETKKIAGYKCTKYKIITEDGDLVTMWVTDEISASKEGLKFVDNKISGFPLEFEVSPEGLTLVFSALEVEKGLKKYNKKEIFDMSIPEGYEIVNPEDLQGLGM